MEPDKTALSHLTTSDQYLFSLFSRGPPSHTPFETVHQAVIYHSRQTPGAIAIRDLSSYSPRELSYSELVNYATYLSRELKRAGIKPGSRVPLIARRGLEMVVGIVGTLLVGAQYVPLDGGVAPDATLHHVLKECAENGVALVTESTKERIISAPITVSTLLVLEEILDQARVARENADTDGLTEEILRAGHLGCYVIYTSGTTGSPKGVDVTHSNVTNLISNAPGNVGMKPGMKVGSVLSIGFDMGAWEVLGALSNGCTLVLRGTDWKVTLREIDILIATPTILSGFNPEEFPNIKFVATAGERLLQQTADSWTKTGKILFSGCGPTEVTIVNTVHVHVAGQPVTIGRPTPNNSVYILDQFQRPVPIGVPGIMWAGGTGVTRGYINLSELTHEKWKEDPFTGDGSMMFNTGDIGYWLPNGALQIIGRVDDQIKIKGFRIELDGITCSLAECSGVLSAVTLLVNSHVCAFVCPRDCDSEEIKEELKFRLPYYAIPSVIYCLDTFPKTQNGKIDREALKGLVEPLIPQKELSLDTRGLSDSFVNTRDCSPAVLNTTLAASRAPTKDGGRSPVNHGSVADSNEKPVELPLSLPPKKNGKGARGLRYRIMIVYRTVFSLIWIANLVAMLIIVFLHINLIWLGQMAFINLTVGILIRNDFIINAVYNLCCSAPTTWPLWIRRRLAKVYHLGGMHSGANSAAVAWYTASLVYNTWGATGRSILGPMSTATLVVSWLTLSLLFIILATAWPPFRKSHHNAFEQIHRFIGWTALALIWVQTILSANDRNRLATTSLSKGKGISPLLAADPNFWLLVTITCSIATSWVLLRRVELDAEVLSSHAVQLHFDYVVPVNGTFTRLSTRPLIEWHSFATVPEPRDTDKRKKGYSLVVSNAGDWTKDKIMNPPRNIWVRGVPACGVMRIATLFNRLVIVGTGSGIGPLLGFIKQPTCAFRLVWSAKHPDQTFGPQLCAEIRRQDPHAVIHDTATQGRPDLVAITWRAVREFKAEGVVVISNEKLTRKVVYGLETRGVAAFGAIWDS